VSRSLRLFVAGAGPAYSDRPSAVGSAYVVRGDGAPILLDIGQGTFPRLFTITRPEDLAAVLISHLHPDHFVDLVPLRHYLRFELDGDRRVRVVAPDALAGRLDALSGEPAFADGALAIETLRAGSVEAPGSGLTIVAAPVTHRDQAFAFRVARAPEGPGLVFSGDCGRASDLEPLIRPGDWLLSEVSFGTGPAPVADLHLDATAVGDLAARTGASRVLLTHLQMGYAPQATIDAVRARYDGPVALVAPGDDVTLSPD
jgi:ribonuclease BN (tRNA processing enzyme)